MSMLESGNSGKSILVASATGPGNSFNKNLIYNTFQATLDNTSTTPAAVVDIEISNDGSTWIVMGTISVSGNGDTDGFTSNAGWRYIRANCTSISDGGGTATVTVTMGG